MLRWECPHCRRPLLPITERRLRCRKCDRETESRGGVWRFDENFEPSGFPAARHVGLAAIEEDHFWFAPRDRLVTHLLQRMLSGSRVADLGCGAGRFLALLERQVPARQGLEGVGIDGHAKPLEKAAKRAPAWTWIHADTCRVPLAAGQFDAAVALDVLEHVEPESFLREAARLVRPGGGLLITVPALPLLWSRMDELAGHRCRYTLRQLRRELAENGWIVQSWTHYQFFLLPMVLLSRWRGRRAERPIERQPPRWLNQLFGWINQMEVDMFAGWSLPWGSSLVVWGIRSDEPEAL